jgi:hypothetical protein
MNNIVEIVNLQKLSIDQISVLKLVLAELVTQNIRADDNAELLAINSLNMSIGNVVTSIEALNDSTFNTNLTNVEEISNALRLSILELLGPQTDTVAKLNVLDYILSEIKVVNDKNYQADIVSMLGVLSSGNTLGNIVTSINAVETAVLGITINNIPELYNLISESTLLINSTQLETLYKLSALDYIFEELQIQTNLMYMSQADNLGITLGGGSTLNSIVTAIQSLESIMLLGTMTTLPSYDVGTPEVEFDQIAKIHKDEMILTPQTSEDVRSGEAIISNIQNINNTTNAPAGSKQEDLLNALKTLTEVLAASQEDIISQNYQLIKNTSERPRTTPVSTTKGII